MSTARLRLHQDAPERFSDPRFYDPGLLADARGARAAVLWCDGEVRWAHEDGRELRSGAEFREAFPDGVVPADGEDGWERIDDDRRLDLERDGEPVGELGTVAEALAALARLAGVSSPARSGTLAQALSRRSGGVSA